ncbi:hypothetical protein ES703_49169 [subsurface metagenome]
MSSVITRAAWAQIRRLVNLLSSHGFTPDEICNLLRLAILARKEDQKKK